MRQRGITGNAPSSGRHKRHSVSLAGRERAALRRRVSAGHGRARELLHARILLKTDQGLNGPAWTDRATAAALELSVLARQFLDRRIPDRATLKREVAAWEAERNSLGAKVDWRFTAQDARIKLRRLYPSIDV